MPVKITESFTPEDLYLWPSKVAVPVLFCLCVAFVTPRYCILCSTVCPDWWPETSLIGSVWKFVHLFEDEGGGCFAFH